MCDFKSRIKKLENKHTAPKKLYKFTGQMKLFWELYA